jgi:hypothetical protein
LLKRKGAEIMNFSKRDLFISSLTQKCRIQGEPVYTSKGTVEFIVNHLYNINSSVRMEVQVTDRIKDFTALRDFSSEDRDELLVDLRAYVEVHPEVYVNDWGPELLYHALVTCASQKEGREKLIQGIRINPNVSYEFFDIEEAEYGAEI